MIVTVGGLPGSGTTTLSGKICSAFGLHHVYAGRIFRDMASERGLTLEELTRIAGKDETIDLEVEERQKRLAVDNSVVEGRVSAFFVDADVRIWLRALREVRAQRVAERERIPLEEALKRNSEREQSEKERYKKYYHIELDDLSVYDLVISTMLWDAEGVFAVAKAALEVRKWL